jgi:hypothetical protein
METRYGVDGSGWTAGRPGGGEQARFASKKVRFYCRLEMDRMFVLCELRRFLIPSIVD